MSASTVRYELKRDVAAQRIHFSATFPEREGAWTLQLPTWRPGRYELGNFAQYVLWVEGMDGQGQRMRLVKQDLHVQDTVDRHSCFSHVPDNTLVVTVIPAVGC